MCDSKWPPQILRDFVRGSSNTSLLGMFLALVFVLVLAYQAGSSCAQTISRHARERQDSSDILQLLHRTGLKVSITTATYNAYSVQPAHDEVERTSYVPVQQLVTSPAFSIKIQDSVTANVVFDDERARKCGGVVTITKQFAWITLTKHFGVWRLR